MRTRNKLVRRITTTAASLAFAGGALLAAGGAAHAAALPAGAHVPARAGAVVETVTAGGHHGGHYGHVWDCERYERFYPWIWEQMETFGYGSARP
ncbi:hypothetical protein SRB17_49010 [Streptomyces sp. RB17]|uniref:hypothetical protein n=1 Tax=Streptomyces sp. RB17 TaxID=2585197 RepID=UPI001297F6B7|nr:hypothetical protein [Streptomyces sp. RB17]MQY36899.1 hypothetical protein [Streptomyces sp. RB17]